MTTSNNCSNDGDKDIRIGYFQAKGYASNDTGYICVALKRPPKGSKSKDYSCAFSFCSPEDVFNKKLARKIALSRLFKEYRVENKSKICHFTSSADNLTEVFIEGMKYAVDNSIDIRKYRKQIQRGEFQPSPKDMSYVPLWAKNRNLTFGLTQG